MPPEPEEARWDADARPQHRPELPCASRQGPGSWLPDTSQCARGRRVCSDPSPTYLQDCGGLRETVGDSRGLEIGRWQRDDGGKLAEVARHRSFLINMDAGSIPAASTKRGDAPLRSRRSSVLFVAPFGRSICGAAAPRFAPAIPAASNHAGASSRSRAIRNRKRTLPSRQPPDQSRR